MSKLPIVDYKTMEALLLKLGFTIIRQKGSHVFFRHWDGRSTTVPNHKGRDLGRPLIREIIRDIELTPDQYKQALEDL
jgi:predicted RNA binding protein YcfA (HicA-like mRNA interferase family)